MQQKQLRVRGCTQGDMIFQLRTTVFISADEISRKVTIYSARDFDLHILYITDNSVQLGNRSLEFCLNRDHYIFNLT